MPEDGPDPEASFSGGGNRSGIRIRLRMPRLPQIPFNGPEIFLLLVLLIAGGVSVVATPIGAGWDEETHVIRAYELANLKFVPNSVSRNELPFPRIFWDLSYRRDAIVRPVASDFWEKYGDLPIGGMEYIYHELPTRSVYSPLLLAPHALVLRYLGLTDRLPALDVYLLARLAGLLTYAAICWFALRLMPFGKWTFAVVAVWPTAVFQASTIGADPLSNAFSLLFIASTLYVSTRKNTRWRDMGLLVATTILLFTAKPNMVFLALLPFLLIKPKQFDKRWQWYAYGGFVVVVGAIEVGGWSFVASSRFFTPGAEIDPLGQLAYVIVHPLEFGSSVWSALVEEGASYLRSMIAEYGYQYWGVPDAVYFLSIGSLAGAMIADAAKLEFKRTTRLFLGGLFLVGFFGTFLALYMANTPVGAPRVLGVQGRYFSVWILPVALAAMPPTRDWWAAWVDWVPGLLGALAVGLFVLALYLVYHVTCGGAYLSLSLCHLPQYKNWAPQARYSEPLPSVGSLHQDMRIECDGLSSIEVWVDGIGEDVSGQAAIEIRDETSGRAVALRTVPFREFPRHGALVIPFPPDERSKGDMYLLIIQGQSEDNRLGPRFSLSIRPEYQAGDLMISGQRSNRDLIFKYGCRAGMLRIASSLFESHLQSSQ